MMMRSVWAVRVPMGMMTVRRRDAGTSSFVYCDNDTDRRLFFGIDLDHRMRLRVLGFTSSAKIIVLYIIYYCQQNSLYIAYT